MYGILSNIKMIRCHFQYLQYWCQAVCFGLLSLCPRRLLCSALGKGKDGPAAPLSGFLLSRTELLPVWQGEQPGEEQIPALQLCCAAASVVG